MQAVLMLVHPEADFGASMLFTGLVEELGASNVIAYPEKLSYYGQTHHYHLRGRPEPGLTGAYPWSAVLTAPTPVASDLRSLIANGHISGVVVESVRPYALEVFQELASDIRAKRLPVILMDAEDYGHIEWKHVHAVQPNVILKREMREELYAHHDYGINGYRVIGFPFSTPYAGITSVLRGQSTDTSVAFLCGSTHPNRRRIADALRAAAIPEAYVAYGEPGWSDMPLLPWDMYIQKLFNSRIAVSALGHGRDTVRFWEAAFITAIASENPRLRYHNPLVPDVHYIHYSQPGELVDKLRWWLEDGQRDALHAMFVNTAAFIETHHTTRRRAQFVLRLIEEYTR